VKLSVTYPDVLLARARRLAAEQGATLSTLIRIALQIGVAELERTRDGPAPSPPRRRVLSRGIGP
jgi:hypothetical protein